MHGPSIGSPRRKFEEHAEALAVAVDEDGAVQRVRLQHRVAAPEHAPEHRVLDSCQHGPRRLEARAANVQLDHVVGRRRGCFNALPQLFFARELVVRVSDQGRAVVLERSTVVCDLGLRWSSQRDQSCNVGSRTISASKASSRAAIAEACAVFVHRTASSAAVKSCGESAAIVAGL
jgi:hypothetical protein